MKAKKEDVKDMKKDKKMGVKEGSKKDMKMDEFDMKFMKNMVKKNKK